MKIHVVLCLNLVVIEFNRIMRNDQWGVKTFRRQCTKKLQTQAKAFCVLFNIYFFSLDVYALTVLVHTPIYPHTNSTDILPT